MSESTIKVDNTPQKCPKLNWKFQKIDEDTVKITINGPSDIEIIEN